MDGELGIVLFSWLDLLEVIKGRIFCKGVDGMFEINELHLFLAVLVEEGEQVKFISRVKAKVGIVLSVFESRPDKTVGDSIVDGSQVFLFAILDELDDSVSEHHDLILRVCEVVFRGELILGVFLSFVNWLSFSNQSIAVIDTLVPYTCSNLKDLQT